MAEVRLALREYRDDMIEQALERLQRDGRITDASSPDEAYDLLVCAWHAERQRRSVDPTRAPSSMTADHHHERRELNRRARALLKADGTVTGAELVVDGAGFSVNDEVIARIGDHELRAEGAPRGEWVRNGARGVVLEVADDHLVVAFERWGEVNVPRSYIEAEVVPGVRGGLMHSYALTTYAAEGATMAHAMALLTDASSREGGYVGLTRGRFDLSAIVIRYDCLVASPVEDALPVVQSELTEIEAVARSLSRGTRERLASQVDPGAARVNALATTMRLDALEEAVATSSTDQTPIDAALYERALRERPRIVGLRGATAPSPEVVAHLGERPAGRDHVAPSTQRRAPSRSTASVSAFWRTTSFRTTLSRTTWWGTAARVASSGRSVRGRRIQIAGLTTTVSPPSSSRSTRSLALMTLKRTRRVATPGSTFR
jgi:hypothetical protein